MTALDALGIEKHWILFNSSVAYTSEEVASLEEKLLAKMFREVDNIRKTALIEF